MTSAVEWCAPQPYRKSVAHRILNRLAMKDSVPGTDLKDSHASSRKTCSIRRTWIAINRSSSAWRFAYKVDGKATSRAISDFAPDGISAAGGLVSTVRDLALLDAALDSTVLLTAGDAGDRLDAANNPDGDPFPTGLGWFVQFYRGERVVWHFGFLPNAYSALMIKLPARHLTFILLANSDRLSAPFQLASGDVTRSVFATLFLKRSTCALAGLC